MKLIIQVEFGEQAQRLCVSRVPCVDEMIEIKELVYYVNSVTHLPVKEDHPVLPLLPAAIVRVQR